MKKSAISLIVLLLVLPFIIGADTSDDTLYPKLDKYVKKAIGGFERIPDERKEDLEKITVYVEEQLRLNKPANLTFICTHNSRRSHMSQIWAQVAAAYYSIQGVTTYSGGTESTAFNPRAVAACRRAGLKITKTTEAENPIYHVRYGKDFPLLQTFLKCIIMLPIPQKALARL